MLAALVTAAVVAAVIGATVRADRRHATKTAAAYGQIRRMTIVDLEFCDVTAEQVAALDQVAVPAGMRRLGDVVARYGSVYEMPVRLFVDSAGTTLGITGFFLGHFIDLCSFAVNDEHVTITRACRKAYPFAAPPFVRRKGLVFKPADDVLAAHLARISGLPDPLVIARRERAVIRRRCLELHTH